MTIQQLRTILAFARIQPDQEVFIGVDYSGRGKEWCHISSFEAFDDGIKLNIVASEPGNDWAPSKRQMQQLGWVAEQNKDNALGKELMTLYNDLNNVFGLADATEEQ